MDAQAVMTVAAAVVALTQLAKWCGLPDKWGPVAVLLFSLFGVALWGYSANDFTRALLFAYFAGWIAVTNATTPPNSGAGSSPTSKSQSYRSGFITSTVRSFHANFTNGLSGDGSLDARSHHSRF